MRPDTRLDYAVFQLSPRCSRCELFVSKNGEMEKLASGLLKPFVTHLKVAEEQVARAVPSIKLEVEKNGKEGIWFTKGTMERFVRFVSTPEVLELVNTFDAEMSQLEAARRIYLQGAGNQLLGAMSDGNGSSTSADTTKKELLRAIDVRLVAVKQDLTTACARASAAGFGPDTVLELQLFADHFGAHRLNEACSKFISLSQKRPDLINSWKAGRDDRAVRSSSESDMSIDDPSEDNFPTGDNGTYRFLPKSEPQHQYRQNQQTQLQTSNERDIGSQQPLTKEHSKSSVTYSVQQPLRESSSERDEPREKDGTSEREKDKEALTDSIQASQPTRRLSVQDRINLFENKQKEQTKGSGGKVVGKSVELRRLSSDVSSAGQAAEKAVLRRWSAASDMSVDLSGERKETESSASTPSSTSNTQNQSSTFLSALEGLDIGALKDTATSCKVELRGLPAAVEQFGLRDEPVSQTHVECFSGNEEAVWLKDQIDSAMHPTAVSGRSEAVECKDQASAETPSAVFFPSSERVGLKDQPAVLPRQKVQMPSEFHNDSRSSLDTEEDLDVKSQTASQSRFRSFPSGPEQMLRDQAMSQTYAGVKDNVASQAKGRASLSRVGNAASKDMVASNIHPKGSLNRVDDFASEGELSKEAFGSFSGRVDNNAGMGDNPANKSQFRGSSSTAADAGFKLKDPLVSQLQSKAFSRKLESESGMKSQAASQADKGRMLASQSGWSSFDRKAPEVGKKDLASSQMQFGGFPAREEGSSLEGMKLRSQSSASEECSKLSSMVGETKSIYRNCDTAFPPEKFTETPEVMDCASITLGDQVQKQRLSKGNQELNDELQIKANELEKLFAAHKLRVPGDQSTTVRRSKATEVQVEQGASEMHNKSVEVTPIQLPERTSLREQFGSSSSVLEFDASPLTRIGDNWDYANTLKHNMAEVCFSEDSRGKFYDKYMQKRDVKLREDWSSQRAEKEAKLKAMQDSLERSRAEMEARFAWSTDRRDSALHSRRRAEKLRSFNIRSRNYREQHPIESLQSEEDEDLSEFHERTQSGQEIGEIFSGDGSLLSVPSKRLLPNRSMPSSTPQTSAALLPRSSVKPSISSGRRRTLPENPLAQSVPNFSDFRKENTKPSSGTSRTTRPHIRAARSKSISEELPLVKEDKPRRSQSLRKSSVNPGTGELKDLSPLNSDDVVFTPLKFDKDQIEQSLHGKVLKSAESKRFLRKGNGIGPGAGAGIAKLKASVSTENLKAEGEIDELSDQLEDAMDLVEDEEQEESEAVMGDELKMVDYLVDSDIEKQGMGMESEKSCDHPESENGEVLRSLRSVDPDLVDEVAASAPSVFHTSAGPVQDSPGESPASWNSRGHHPFSYTQETSDIDTFVESPMGSPASWNLHSLAQMDADAARMRKKWGSAQKPILVANASNQQSRKDVTKGFKRLLKFGRKSRGTESVVDWISATTSEGDDDTEDGRDLANRSSEDLRKSRMGFPQDGFNDGELFNEQVQALNCSIPAPPANFKLREEHLSGSSLKAPRSFFSLSSFRSKGSESKPR